MAQKKITGVQIDTVDGTQVTGTVANATLAATVTTNADLTGDVTSVGNATTLGTVPATKGGTGQTTIATGDVLYGSATNTISKLAAGTDGHVLTLASGIPSWAAGGGGSSSNTYKEAVRGATTANISLTGNVALDGITTAAGNRILVKNQSSASQNGIYVASAGAWSRASDFDTTGDEVANGAIIPVQFGTVNGGSLWQLMANGGTVGNSFLFGPVSGTALSGISTATIMPAASATNAIAIGTSSTAVTAASGTNSIAIGSANYGNGTRATTANSIAIGTTASVLSNTGGIAIGGSARVTGQNGINIGVGGNDSSSGASGNNSIMIGRQTAASTVSTEGIALGLHAGASYSAYTISIGSNHTNAISGGVAIGFQTTTEMTYEIALGGAQFADFTSPKTSIVRPIAYTTSASVTEMTLGTPGTNGLGTTHIVLENDRSYVFKGQIIARNTNNASNDTSAWDITFCIKRDANAAATALVGSVTKTVIGQDAGAAAWDVTVTADTTNGRPKIEVTGAASTNIKWYGTFIMTKVTG